MNKRRILITGAKGMLGRTLVRHWSEQHAVIATDLAELDITDAAACTTCVTGVQPDVVVHCAAHTAVDRSTPSAARISPSPAIANVRV